MQEESLDRPNSDTPEPFRDDSILRILNYNAMSSSYRHMSDRFKKMVSPDNKFMALFIQLVDANMSYSDDKHFKFGGTNLRLQLTKI